MTTVPNNGALHSPAKWADFATTVLREDACATASTHQEIALGVIDLLRNTICGGGRAYRRAVVILVLAILLVAAWRVPLPPALPALPELPAVSDWRVPVLCRPHC